MALHVAADAEMRRRFETEARAVAALSHPCILAIHELAVVAGLPVVMSRLGRTDEAMGHLTALVDRQLGSVIFLAIEPALAALRGRPDFAALLTRIGAPHRPTASAPHTASP